MTRRRIFPAIALCIVTIAAVACGWSANTPAAPDTETAPTTSDQPLSGGPQSDAPPLRPPGRGLAPGAPDGAGRISRFVPLDNPAIVSAEAATFLQPDDRVLGLTVGGESRAYPINMMTFHHVANDVLGGLPVLVTF
ncbi:MAG: DUF3179 domain-containing protein [Chloroflexi bacterium]|nr:DUF3179 domain-containing protein [Chloroflexota bacterium]